MRSIGAIAIALVAFVLVACVVTGQKPKPQIDTLHRFSRIPATSYAGGYDYSQYFDRTPEASVTCPEFFQMLDDTDPSDRPDTVVAALELLKRNKPKYFSRYVLMPQSRSLHGSSWANPRAMVLGGTGEMVVTFNGESHQDGYGRLEIMCFRKSDSTFEFREVVFPKEAAGDLDDLSVKQLKQAYVISPPNGFKGSSHDCRQCHQTPARPNWDTYPTWPSSYGADDDLLFQKEFYEQFYQNEKGTFTSLYHDAEKEMWGKFLGTGRYKVLPPLSLKVPNLTAGKIFAVLNAQRIVGDLKRLGPKFKRVKGAFARALYCPLSGLEPRVFEPQEGYGTTMTTFVAPLDPNVKKMILNSAAYFDEKDLRLKQNFNIQPISQDRELELSEVISAYFRTLGFDANQASKIHKVKATNILRLAAIQKVVQPLGIEIENWSMILHGGYEFEDGSGGDAGTSFAQVLDEPFLKTFYANDPVLISLVQARRNLGEGVKSPAQALKEETAICEHLK